MVEHSFNGGLSSAQQVLFGGRGSVVELAQRTQWVPLEATPADDCPVALLVHRWVQPVPGGAIFREGAVPVLAPFSDQRLT